MNPRIGDMRKGTINHSGPEKLVAEFCTTLRHAKEAEQSIKSSNAAHLLDVSSIVMHSEFDSEKEANA